MGRIAGLLLLLLLACFITYGGAFWNVQKRFNGELLPADPLVCTTQNVTFTCVLNDDPVSNFSIGFTFKTRETNGKFVTVDQNRVTHINETMAQYTVSSIPPLSDVNKPYFMYVKSFYWQEIGDINETLQLGTTTSVRVYPMPEEVKDFACIVNNYKTMICSWKYGTDYGTHMPEVIFLWRIPYYSTSWTECKYLNTKDGSCTWNETRAGFFKNSNITIRLTLKQRCKIDVTSEFHIDTSKIVKPDPVSSIRSNVISSTCITLLWKAANSGPFYPKEHLITVSSRGVAVTNSTLTTTMDSEQFEHTHTFCGLRPYTAYSFSVRIRPTGVYSGYYSEPVIHTSTTYSDIPSASPDVTDYRWDQRECEDGGEKRLVCLFWKPIKAENQNGPMKALHGEFTALPPANHIIKEDWAAEVTYGCSFILCNTSYLFTIKARNINGTSKRGPAITIPSFVPGSIIDVDHELNVGHATPNNEQNAPPVEVTGTSINGEASGDGQEEGGIPTWVGYLLKEISEVKQQMKVVGKLEYAVQNISNRIKDIEGILNRFETRQMQ